ncbi:MAG: GNAT family N-acetyltransferase [Theionarchaea archaeon]|nr:GNAT family N-acetyltransferase [Theionarchaea archaeon]
MEYRVLESESWETIHECFDEAFSDYAVEMHVPFDKFQNIMLRNGVDLKYSMGLYDAEKLVGFIVNGTGVWHDLPTVYDSGTGILREYRGKKYSRTLFSRLRDLLSRTRYQQYLLEVIQTNIPAYTLYLREGFTMTRELQCFRIEKERLHREDPHCDIQFRTVSVVDWDAVTAFWNAAPSWQNSIPAIERISSQFEKIAAYAGGTLTGYGVFGRESGELVHIAVRKDFRKRGIGTALLNEISSRTQSPGLRIVNIDGSDKETTGFLRKRGFENDVNQFEMILPLKKRSETS